MDIYVPFLIPKNNETYITPQMELASAFIYFELNRGESKSIFAKQQKESAVCITRGFYPIKAKLLSREEKLYCLYDNLGIMGDMEINCKLDFEGGLDISGIKPLNIKDKTEEIKKISDAIKRKEKTSLNTNGLIHGYSGIGEIFKGREMDELYGMTVNLENHGTGLICDPSVIGEVLSKIEKSIEDEINLTKALCNMDDEGFNDSANERNRVYEEYRDKIYKTDKEISDRIASLIIERQEKIRDIEKIYSDKKLYAMQDYIYNKNKCDMSKIYGNEIETEIFQRSMGSADDKVKQLAREESEEVKKVEKHYDTLLDSEKKKLEDTVFEREKMIAECEEPYNRLHISIEELKKAIVDDISLRRGQIEKIRSWFWKPEGSLDCDSVNIYIPFYASWYNDGKYRLFSPHALEGKSQIISILSGITGKVPQPFGDRDSFLAQLFDKLHGYINGAGKDVAECLTAENLLCRDGVLEMVENGLLGLVGEGYLSEKNLEKIAPDIRAMFCSQSARDNQ